MDVLPEFLEDLKRQGLAEGCLLGFLHIMIGRRIQAADGTVIIDGMSWRDLSACLKKARWEKTAVVELGLSPADLPPRDRQRFWYTAICQAKVDSQSAVESGEVFAERLRGAGYIVSGPAR